MKKGIGAIGALVCSLAMMMGTTGTAMAEYHEYPTNQKKTDLISGSTISNITKDSATVSFKYNIDSSLKNQIEEICAETVVSRTLSVDKIKGTIGIAGMGSAKTHCTPYTTGYTSSGQNLKVANNDTSAQGVATRQKIAAVHTVSAVTITADGKNTLVDNGATYTDLAWQRQDLFSVDKDLGGKMSGTLSIDYTSLFRSGTKYGNWGEDWWDKVMNDPNVTHADDPYAYQYIDFNVWLADGTLLYDRENLPTFTTKSDQQPVSFRDVDAKTPHVDDIEWLASAGISTGWREADGSATFRGMSSVKRQDMAAFLYRLAGSPAFDESKAGNPFRDVTSRTPHYKEILWLASTGVTTGWTERDGSRTFRGMNSVVRQDMAAFLRRLADYEKASPALGADVAFGDVSASTPHSADIAWLAKTGVTTGWTERDGSRTYRGMRPVVRQDMAAFLHRMNTNVLK
ncbi:S-layer homology domain-containing protein [Bifidobacterium ramosum]|nr:S-layer homology domain-containing protein [Bifidobacterium ramosum]